jgi:VTC domain-containing protein
VEVGSLGTVSLEELESRAALLRRVDRKYLLDAERLDELLGRLCGDHDVLEIDGERTFAYESTYFDTPDLRCFHDHVRDREPRFKVRSRWYRDSGVCVFEVKLKRAGGDTDKRQIEYSAERRAFVTPGAAAFVDDALSDVGLALSRGLEASLTTSFRRMTLAAHEGSARLTCDFDVELARGQHSAVLRDSLTLLETKSEDGDSSADRVLASMGIEELDVSKYRAGIALLAADPSDAGGAQRFFEVRDA